MSRAALWGGVLVVAGGVGVSLWMLAGDGAVLDTKAQAPSNPPADAPEPRASWPIPREATQAATSKGDGPSGGAAGGQTGPSTPKAGALAPGATAPSASATKTPLARVAGVVRDELGFVLADHVVELSSEGPVPGGARVIDGSDATDARGRFRIDEVTPGLKELRVLGPGEGDVWRWIDDLDAPLDEHVELAVEERRLTLDVPESGSDDLVLKCRGHREILVTARLVDDLYRPIDRHAFQFERDVQDFGRAYSETDGSISALVTVERDTSVELFVDDLSMRELRELAEQMGEALGPPQRYLPIEVQLRTAPRRQELGMLVVPRMAGLALTLVDNVDGEVVGEASVRLRCTGGGVPPSDETSQTGGQPTCLLWSGRTTGAYELDVTATGYRPAHQVGVLQASDGPRPLELILERTR